MQSLPLARVLVALSFPCLVWACAGEEDPGESRPDPDPTGPDGVLATLAAPDAAHAFALHPYPHEVEGEDGQRFHGYLVLGEATVTEAATRDRLLALLEAGIEASDGRVAACFNPRHGLRVEADGRTTDLVICFECLSMRVFEDGEPADGHRTSERHAGEVTELFERLGLRLHDE